MNLVLFSLLILLTQNEPQKLALPEGHNAYSIKSDAKDLNRFIGPGSKVDVLLFAKVNEREIVSVMLTRVLIIAVDADSADETKIKVYTTTLAVKPEDAKTLAEAEKKGRLFFLVPCPSGRPDK